MAEEYKKIHPLQLAWAAGVFDSRGNVPKSGYVLRFESTDEPLMKRFKETLGFGRFVDKDRKECSRPVWVYETTSMRDAWELITIFSPFLSAGKLKQCGEMLARIERSPNFLKKHGKELADRLVNKPKEG